MGEREADGKEKKFKRSGEIDGGYDLGRWPEPMPWSTPKGRVEAMSSALCDSQHARGVGAGEEMMQCPVGLSSDRQR